MDVHPAVAGFDRRAEDYEKGRPSYPSAAVDWLVQALRIGPGATVVDLAAGTGKLTCRPAPHRARVLAVEPVAGMREVLREAVPWVEIFEGTAEQMPFPDGSVDAVTVGQAFHWFRGDEALAEIDRLLRPGGRLGLVWNRRDQVNLCRRSWRSCLTVTVGARRPTRVSGGRPLSPQPTCSVPSSPPSSRCSRCWVTNSLWPGCSRSASWPSCQKPSRMRWPPR